MEKYVVEKKGGLMEQQVLFRAKGNVSVQKLMADFNEEMAAYFKVDSHLIDHQGEKYAIRLHAEGGKINLRMFKAGDKDAKPVEIPTAIYQRYESDILKAWEKVSGGVEVKRHVSRP